MSIDRNIKADLLDRVSINQSFDFMNVYKGLPLVYKARLQSVGEKSAKFKVDPPSSICLGWENCTTILEDANTNAINANVVNFDIKNGLVELTDFKYANRGIGYRMMVRVEPKDIIPVNIIYKNQTIPGDLADISLTGFGVRTQTLGNLQLRETVQLEVTLMEQRITPIGTLINITEEDDGLRLAIRFGVEMTIPVATARYITHRRAEIHREIHEAYEKAIESAKKS